MTYTPATVDAFGGLDLYTEPHDVGFAGAVTATNVDLSRPGRLMSRPGSVRVNPTVATFFGTMCHYQTAGGASYVVAQTNVSTTTPLSLDGTSNGATLAAVAGSNNGMTVYGNQSTGPRLYLTDGTASMHRYNGTAWTTVTLPSSFPAYLVATKPGSNRLVVASVDTVRFSNPDDPETFSADDFVTLDGGDGEVITGLVPWREYLIVFKQTKFYVFTAESVDTSGGAIFTYRTVNAGRGAVSPGSTAAGEDAVYFCSHDGLYATVGDVPVYLSRVLENHARVKAGTFFPPLWMAYMDRQVVILNTNFFEGFVYDTRTQQFVEWALDAWSMCVGLEAGPVARPALYVAAYGPDYLCKMTESGDTDAGTTTSNGTAVAWTYESGLSDLGVADRKVVREVETWGEGDTTFSYRADSPAYTTGSVTPDANGKSAYRSAQRGTFFQFKVDGTTGVLDRIVFRLRDQEVPK